MTTLNDVKEGRLRGTKTLTLSENLVSFPEEILDLADTLEQLDLARNRISTLPDSFSRLKKLRILFLSFNQFTTVPNVLSACPNLTIVGFKSNHITDFPENGLPPSLRWLILTDNQIEKIPRSIGKLPRLEKVALAGNNIQTLPEELSLCTNLGLLRISANQLQEVPPWLPTMPRLAWLALAGNPICRNRIATGTTLTPIDYGNLTLQETLGQGASGTTYRAQHRHNGITDEVAVKIFKGALTSDGYVEDEIAAHIATGPAPHLLSAFGNIINHPHNAAAIALPFIPATYQPLGTIPNFETCTRDCYDNHTPMRLESIQSAAVQIATAAQHLHSKGIMHGDLYAHNILTNYQHFLLGDLGAASRYGGIPEVQKADFERVDVLAYGYLLEELLLRATHETQKQSLLHLINLKDRCISPLSSHRPLFSEIIHYLTQP
jgi:hypothetical protein